MRPHAIVASDVSKIGGRPVGWLPMDCPYCRETLQDVLRGWVCLRCGSTVGAALKVNSIEEGQ